MFAIDFLGLGFTVCLAGVRYPHWVLLAAFVQEAGRILMVVFLDGRIEAVIAAGVFSTTSVANVDAGVRSLLIILSGPLANYIVSATYGGIVSERTADLINPLSRLRNPFSTVNLRLAVLSAFFNLWQLV